MYVYCILGIMIYTPTFVCSWVMKSDTKGLVASVLPRPLDLTILP
jgi:hypothetical protein